MPSISVKASSRIPFSGARSFVAHPLVVNMIGDECAVYLRSVSHSSPGVELSLSDAQTPGDQLRFYTKERVIRGLVYIGDQLAGQYEDGITVEVDGALSEADHDFFAALESGGLLLELEPGRQSYARPLEEEDAAFERTTTLIEKRQLDESSIAHELDRLLAYGDSWSAVQLARTVGESGYVPGPKLATSMALAYGLQGDSGEAERLFKIWEDEGGIEAARAKYSLAMMYARHHPTGRLDDHAAGRYLQEAYEILTDLEQTKAVVYETVFNRNGYALLLFRWGRYDEAALLLEHGIAILGETEWDGQLHQTVLLNNLGRVYGALGRPDDAERTLRQAALLDPLFAEYWQDLASFLCDHEQLEEAFAAATEARKLDPAITGAHELYAYISERLGRADAAVDGYTAAWTLGSAQAGLALLRLLSDSDRHVEVIEIWRRVAASLESIEDRSEAELIGLEAASFADPEIDIFDNLLALQAKYPESAIVTENLMAARSRIS